MLPAPENEKKTKENIEEHKALTGWCVVSIPSLRKTLPTSKTRGMPPTTARLVRKWRDQKVKKVKIE